VSIYSKSPMGKFYGKIGLIVGARKYGKSYARSLAEVVSNPNTKPQQVQRSKFKTATRMLQSMSGYLDYGYPNAHRNGMTAVNATASHLLKNAIKGKKLETISVDYSKLKVSEGTLEKLYDPTMSMSTLKVGFDWTDNSTHTNAEETDYVMPLVYCPDLNDAVYDVRSFTRKDEHAELSIPSFWAGHEIHAYLSVRTEQSADNMDMEDEENDAVATVAKTYKTPRASITMYLGKMVA